MSIEERTLTKEGYTSMLQIITVEPGGFTDTQDDKIRLLLNFGEHGRELISPEIALRLLEALCEGDTRSALLKSYGIDLEPFEHILGQTVFKIIPMENPGGRALVEQGELCERKNGRGVDPNRNWAVHWGHKEIDYDPSEEFPGSKPFSEPESAMLRMLAEEFSPHVWLNVHSGMQAMFLPYDHKNEVPEGAAAAATLAILEGLNRKMCKGVCAVGPGGKTVGYLAHGTATDYMHDELKIGLVMTWEVYGDDNAEFHDCFRMFNPLTAPKYEKVVSQWTAAVFELVAALPGHPAVQFGGGETDQKSEQDEVVVVVKKGVVLGRKGIGEQTIEEVQLMGKRSRTSREEYGGGQGISGGAGTPGVTSPGSLLTEYLGSYMPTSTGGGGGLAFWHWVSSRYALNVLVVVLIVGYVVVKIGSRRARFSRMGRRQRQIISL